ncbi:tRNA pseudouridine(38-40) synthase TruA ['Osedax' symbiont bacterium Rs2_46_30_T18]|nr:tRNA pseudouridine(38-40) synthase TruA ['Osedax' symbiont bacterium Rs2_46_30_T18]
MSDIEQSKQLEATQVASSRLALCIEYAGENYKGWQKQKFDALPTVQEHVEKALSKVANHPVSVICAGRTDTGVNGTYQIIHFDSIASRDLRAWVLGTNSNLPQDISVQWAKKVDDSFHARFSALNRRYRYIIYSNAVMPGILPKGVTWTHKSLNLESMQRAAQFLVGEHDFSSYRAVACQAKSPVRTISDISLYRSGELLVIDVQANAFLHHMIRNIAGVLMKIGAAEAEPEWAQQVLLARDRREGGVTAPPHGLYFVDVKYPQKYQLPASKLGPYFITARD